ncbi:MAG: cobyrinate a,c-diamide synthase [Clostridiales bacterium]|nr:cobyrinate a,c-diamide synthase [Clostridiales bacterium]
MNVPRILLAAPSSQSGKTTVTMGILKALKDMGKKVLACKCGPDYIDPMFHKKVLGIESINLDTFFTDDNTTRYLLGSHAQKKDLVVMEGVMGYYDGLAGTNLKASSYDVACVTDTPVVLVVYAKGSSRSLLAVIKGMLEYQSKSRICGVILNQIAPSIYPDIARMIEEELKIPVFGYLPRLDDALIDSRHLGLKTPDELDDLDEKITLLGEMAKEYLDFEKLFFAASKAPAISCEEPELPKLHKPVTVAVARDEAFCFYYEDNMELLKKMGAKIVFFSPLKDDGIPEDADGLILGGGYPELYAKKLEENSMMRNSIRTSIRQAMPCLAECGGFLYLHDQMEEPQGTVCSMAGIVPGKAVMKKRLQRFGYVSLTLKKPGIFGEEGQKIRGHEFHYYDSTRNGDFFLAKKPGRGEDDTGKSRVCYECGYGTGTLMAGFPHLYYYSNPSMIYEFLRQCVSYQAYTQSKRYWDQIAKPIGSLGRLEKIVSKMAYINGQVHPVKQEKRALLIMCADHGVVKEGVTQTDSSVTKTVSENFAKGASSVNQMADVAHVDVYPIDIGMDTEEYPEKELKQHVVVNKKIARGSGNILKESAMTKEQCIRALRTGVELVGACKEMGYDIIATGEMGIGNTTPSSALASALLSIPANEATGRGAGLSDEAYAHKIQVVRDAVARVPKDADAFTLLCELGGYDIAGMAGCFLGAVRYQIPVIIDGAISSVAALVADRLDNRTRHYVIASHESDEITGKLAQKSLGLKPVIHGKMRLGEGTGSIALIPLIEMACRVYEQMGTFEANQIAAYERYDTGEEVEL